MPIGTEELAEQMLVRLDPISFIVYNKCCAYIIMQTALQMIDIPAGVYLCPKDSYNYLCKPHVIDTLIPLMYHTTLYIISIYIYIYIYIYI